MRLSMKYSTPYRKPRGLPVERLPQYWARREYESGDLVGERLRREHDNLFRLLSQEEQNQFTRYRELDRELE